MNNKTIHVSFTPENSKWKRYIKKKNASLLAKYSHKSLHNNTHRLKQSYKAVRFK